MPMLRKEDVKRLPFSQFMWLLENHPARARYISLVLGGRIGSQITTERGHRRWRALLNTLPDPFTKHDLPEDKWSMVESMRRRGWVKKIGTVASHAGGGNLTVFEKVKHE